MIALLIHVFSERRRRHVVTLLLAAAGCVLGGAGLFALSQSIPFTSALYWAITTATTVGYGDVTPHNAAGRVIASAVMLTTIPLLAAVFALVTAGATAAGIRRILNVEDRFPAGTYRLIVGMSPVVPAILAELEAAGVPVVLAADVDPATVRRGVHVVRGNPTEPATVRAARPEGAQQALVTGVSDGDVLVSAVILRKQAPDLSITALVTSASVCEALREIGIQQAVSADELLARTVATTLESPHAGDLIAQLVESGRDMLTEVDAEPAAIGKPLSVVRGERGGLVLGLVHASQFTLGIGDDPVIAAGDRLLIAQPAPRERRRATRLPADRR
ncbi:MAG TPA: potassium channel family protein [Streptosporangiaceae bacterium]|nr:potassium channel family protein [Streptosporangiaceae bacterium]